MSRGLGRRDQQKAQTRARIREVAQDLFAAHGFHSVTITHIAAAAQVSVQTVFNHFSSKDELFFAERANWVDGAAAAIRSRAPGERPQDALRRHLVRTVELFARAVAEPQNRQMLEVLDGTPALLAYERSLHDESVAKLAAALAELRGPGGGSDGGRPSPLDEVTAAVWMAAVRSIVLDLRCSPPSPGDEDTPRERAAFADRVLADLGSALSFADAGRGAHSAA